MYQYNIIFNGLWGIKPANQASLELLTDGYKIPTYCWLGDICYLQDKAFYALLNAMAVLEDITLVDSNGVEYIPENNNN